MNVRNVLSGDLPCGNVPWIPGRPGRLHLFSLTVPNGRTRALAVGDPPTGVRQGGRSLRPGAHPPGANRR